MRTLINSPVNSLGRVRRSSLRLLRAVTVLGALLVSALALAEPPTISLDDPVTVRIRQGQPYDPNNPGATATDPEDGSLTVVVADNPVNIKDIHPLLIKNGHIPINPTQMKLVWALINFLLFPRKLTLHKNGDWLKLKLNDLKMN